MIEVKRQPAQPTYGALLALVAAYAASNGDWIAAAVGLVLAAWIALEWLTPALTDFRVDNVGVVAVVVAVLVAAGVFDLLA